MTEEVKKRIAEQVKLYFGKNMNKRRVWPVVGLKHMDGHLLVWLEIPEAVVCLKLHAKDSPPLQQSEEANKEMDDLLARLVATVCGFFVFDGQIVHIFDESGKYFFSFPRNAILRASWYDNNGKVFSFEDDKLFDNDMEKRGDDK